MKPMSMLSGLAVVTLALLVGCASLTIPEEEGPLFKKYGFRFSDYSNSREESERASKRLSEIYPAGTDPEVPKKDLDALGMECRLVTHERKDNGDIWVIPSPKEPGGVEVITPNDPRHGHEVLAMPKKFHCHRVSPVRRGVYLVTDVIVLIGFDGKVTSIRTSQTFK